MPPPPQPAPARTARVVLLLLAGSSASGCGTLADGHALETTVGASLHRFEGALRETVSGLDREVRTGLRETTDAALAAPAQMVRRADRLRAGSRRIADLSIARAETAPLRVRDAAVAVARSESYRAAKVTSTVAPSSLGTQLERSTLRFRSELAELPATLRLDRRPLPEPGDPESATDPLPERRSASLFERVLSRIPW